MAGVTYQRDSIRAGELRGKQALLGVHLTNICQEPLGLRRGDDNMPVPGGQGGPLPRPVRSCKV